MDPGSFRHRTRRVLVDVVVHLIAGGALAWSVSSVLGGTPAAQFISSLIGAAAGAIAAPFNARRIAHNNGQRWP